MAEFEVRTDGLNNVANNFERISRQVSDISQDARRILSNTRGSITAKISYALQRGVVCGNIDNCSNDFLALSKGLSKTSSLYFKHENKAKEKDFPRKNGSSVVLDTSDDGKSYDDWLKYRYDNANDPRTRELYDKFKDKIVINSDDYNDTAHYNGKKNHINYNKEDDLESKKGPGTTYYHEVGHLIDDQSDWNNYTSVDSRYDFYEKLSNDVDNYLKKIMKEEGCSKKEAYQHFSNWLLEDPDAKNGVSDIVNGITDGKSCGRWSHSDSYYNEKSISKEAFAHFFEAGMSANPEKLAYIKEVFPSAYKEYQKMIENELK